MLNAAKKPIDNVYFEDQQPDVTDSRDEILAGLKARQKRINPKYFYDERGSELFEQITETPEYYPTRTELSILDLYAEEMAEYCGTECVLIEPGSGSSEKVRLLLDALRPAAYVPLDISADFLYQSAVRLGREFPWLTVHAICADFSDQWQAPDLLPDGKRVVFYPGSTIGNMEPDIAKVFLSQLREITGEEGGVLIGVDLHKSEAVLNKAYNDDQGVTAEFNLNVLNQMNRMLEADFDANVFSHRAFYNTSQQRIEMHLVSKKQHSVCIENEYIEFEEGETIHTENSYKYTLDSFSELAHGAGFAVRQSWLDEQSLFSVHYLEVTRL